MALGKQPKARQHAARVVTRNMPRPPGHPVYQKLNEVLAAKLQPADWRDPDTLPETLAQAPLTTLEAGGEGSVHDVVADTGYHKAEGLPDLEA